MVVHEGSGLQTCPFDRGARGRGLWLYSLDHSSLAEFSGANFASSKNARFACRYNPKLDKTLGESREISKYPQKPYNKLCDSTISTYYVP